jgi:acetyl esterase
MTGSRTAKAGPFAMLARLSAIGLLAATALPAAADHHGGEAAKAAMAGDVVTTPFVRPDVRAYLDKLAENPRPAMTREMLAMIRKMPPEMIASQMKDDLPVGELGEIRDVTMPGPGGEMKLRLYDPRPAAERGAGPVVVFYHGGAFVVGSIQTHAGLTAEMARVLDLPVISVEYRLAPEHPWPAAPDDAEAAARWIADNGSAFDREFTGLVISGDSAGGNLTLVTALALRNKRAKLPVLMQLPIYPASDRTKTYPSGEMFAEGYGLGSGSVPKEDLYKADPNSWRASPLLADLAGLPPTVLVTASLDPLRDQGRAFAAKLVESGVSTAYYEAHGNIHGFATYRKAIPSSQHDTQAFLSLAKSMLEVADQPEID